MPEHGGRLRAAARHYGLAPEHWLDLSTGINPQPWPVPSASVASWQRLPEDDDGLAAAAQRYIGAPRVLPVAGSQAAIQALPLLRARSRIGVLSPGYNEHAHRWRQAGHEVWALDAAGCEAQLSALDVVVVCNPNNPTGERFARERLLRWHAQLATHGGWLVVDEAYLDCDPHDSLAADTTQAGLVVLRSLGKFFGLAGARIGFICAHAALLDRLDAQLGPWAIAGPAREIAQRALDDHAWQAAMRAALPQQAARLVQLLRAHGLAPLGGCALFQWVCTPQAAALHERLARQGVLVRRFDAPESLRFGLPGREADWARLDAALAQAAVGPRAVNAPSLGDFSRDISSSAVAVATETAPVPAAAIPGGRA